MIRIESAPARIRVEIDGREYPVAERTPKTERRLARATRIGDPARRKRRLLRVLLGRRAARELLPGKRRRDLDRLDLLAAGVLDAYRENRRRLRARRLEKAALELQAALAPIDRTLDRLERLRPARAEPAED
ncbi:MAG: hypothetical protein IJH78_04355 [Clostridia bacterium]|nr:hypothetical protein [Clostridia bacterium]